MPQKGKTRPLGLDSEQLRHIWAHLKQCFPTISSCFPSTCIFLVHRPPPAITTPLCAFHHHHHRPLFLHVKLGKRVYTWIFKAALFSVKCCVATSNALPDRAFLGFQRGGRIIGGRPQRIWQMCDEFLLERCFFLLFLEGGVVSLWEEGEKGDLEGKYKGFLCCHPCSLSKRWPQGRRFGQERSDCGHKHCIQTRYLNPACGIWCLRSDSESF